MTSAIPSSQGNGGKIATSTRAGFLVAAGITPLTRSRASPALTGFIFQLPAAGASRPPRAGISAPRWPDRPRSRLLENRYSRQFPPLEVLEGGSAACRDVREAAGEAERIDGGGGVAATDESVSAGTRDRLSNTAGSVAEVRDLEHAHRAVPDHRARPFHAFRERSHRLRADVERDPS